MIKEIYILGVGHNTDVFIDLAETCGYKVVGLFHYNDERTGELVHDIPILGSNEDLFKENSLENMYFAVSIGDNKIRETLSRKISALGGNLPILIHPTAIVSKYATLSAGVIIHPNVVVQAGATISKYSILSYNSSVTHHSSIGVASYLAANANIGAYVKVENNVLVGQGAIIVSSKVPKIGNSAIVGAGAVVIHEVEEKQVVAGNPARIIKQI